MAKKKNDENQKGEKNTPTPGITNSNIEEETGTIFNLKDKNKFKDIPAEPKVKMAGSWNSTKPRR